MEYFAAIDVSLELSSKRGVEARLARVDFC